MSLAEGQFIESERRAVQQGLDAVPVEEEAFMEWFEGLCAQERRPDEPLLNWLESAAPLADLQWFLLQDVASTARYDALVALTQLRMPPALRIPTRQHELDEIRQGHAVYAQLAHAHVLTAEAPMWESLALANLAHGLAANRRYAYQSIGALGLLVSMAPTWNAAISAAAQRVAGGARLADAALDVPLSTSWNATVVRPLIDGDPWIARAIAEGALLRLAAVSRCLARFHQMLMPNLPYSDATRRIGSSPLRFRRGGAPLSFR